MTFTLNRKCKNTKEVKQSGSQGDNDDDKYDKVYYLLFVYHDEDRNRFNDTLIFDSDKDRELYIKLKKLKYYMEWNKRMEKIKDISCDCCGRKYF